MSLLTIEFMIGWRYEICVAFTNQSAGVCTVAMSASATVLMDSLKDQTDAHVQQKHALLRLLHSVQSS